MSWRSIITYRVEWGSAAENLYLASEAIGAGSCAIIYDQAKVDRILGVDGKEEFAIYVAPMGKVSSATYHFDH